MFGTDDQKQTNNNDDTAQPTSTQPVNEGLLGINNDDDTPSSAPVATDTNNNLPDDEMPKSNTSHTDDALLNMKREALEELSPLIDKLDQTPEERFDTLMMMIQATDNQSLLTDAFATAKEIKDEKKRARALLDVVNEINYFTQPKN